MELLSKYSTAMTGFACAATIAGVNIAIVASDTAPRTKLLIDPPRVLNELTSDVRRQALLNGERHSFRSRFDFQLDPSFLDDFPACFDTLIQLFVAPFGLVVEQHQL